MQFRVSWCVCGRMMVSDDWSGSKCSKCMFSMAENVIFSHRKQSGGKWEALLAYIDLVVHSLYTSEVRFSEFMSSVYIISNAPLSWNFRSTSRKNDGGPRYPRCVKNSALCHFFHNLVCFLATRTMLLYAGRVSLVLLVFTTYKSNVVNSNAASFPAQNSDFRGMECSITVEQKWQQRKWSWKCSSFQSSVWTHFGFSDTLLQHLNATLKVQLINNPHSPHFAKYPDKYPTVVLSHREILILLHSYNFWYWRSSAEASPGRKHQQKWNTQQQVCCVQEPRSSGPEALCGGQALSQKLLQVGI